MVCLVVKQKAKEPGDQGHGPLKEATSKPLFVPTSQPQVSYRRVRQLTSTTLDEGFYVTLSSKS